LSAITIAEIEIIILTLFVALLCFCGVFVSVLISEELEALWKVWRDYIGIR